tara:strand:+ start:75726 stop:76505 length:780 start_codon:yes stop_codon:yes gene_type:complete
MQDELKIAAIQVDLFWENKEKNLRLFEHRILQLDADTDLIILPEMFSTGFTMQPSAVAETMQGATVQWMLAIAESTNVGMVGSLVIKENNQYYNRVVFVKPNRDINTYDKRHLFSLAGEDKVYTSGENRLITLFKGWKICPLICYDLRFPVWSRNCNDYDLLLYVANWPIPRISSWDALLKVRAIENMSYCVGLNRVGEDANGYLYNGHTKVYDCVGKEIASTTEGDEEILQCILSKSLQEKTRKKFNFLNDRDLFTIN